MFVPDASGDHMVETYSSMGLLMVLYVERIVYFGFPNVVGVSALSICIVLRTFVVMMSMCLLYVSLRSRVSPSILGLMDNRELPIANVYTPNQLLQWALFTTTLTHADMRIFTNTGRLQCSLSTLALLNNRYERQPTVRFNKHFQLFRLKRSFSHKAPWECRTSSPGVPLASAYLITSSKWQTHTTICISLSDYSQLTRHLIISRPHINLKTDYCTGYKQEIEGKPSSRHLPTNC